MNNYLNGLAERVVRPSVIRLGVAALVIITSISGGFVACKKEAPKNLTGAEKVDCPPFPLEPHEPPITVTEGSLKLDMEQPLTQRTGTAPRPFEYSIGPERYSDISRMQVITETKTGIFDVSMYLPRQRSQLRIWLQKKDVSGNWSTITSDPQIVFTFVDSGEHRGLSIESEQRLLPGDSPKPDPRDYRYDYEAYPAGQVKRFRLAKWSLNKFPGGQVITGPDGLPFQGELNATTFGFQIVVFFIHEH